MRYTLLQIVHSVLGALDSDAVSTIGETAESEQIAQLARDVYYELCNYQDVPDLARLTQLEGLNDPALRTVMRIPRNATEIMDVRYKHTDANGVTRMEKVLWVEPEDFLDSMLDLTYSSLENVGYNELPDNVLVPYRTDRGPTCYTSFDNEHLVFDAIDTVIQQDSTLHNDSSMVRAYIVPPFVTEDDFIPDLPIKVFPQYLNMVKELAFNEQKQIEGPIHRRNGERQGHRNRHFASVADGLNKGSYAGREGFGRSVRSSGRSYIGRGLPRIR